MSGELASKTAVVTGASSGIGAAIAEAMARAGANVLLTGRDAARLGTRADAVRGEGHAAESLAVDLTAEGAPQQVVDAALEHFGSLDVVVHSAGIFEPGPFAESSLESFDRQMNLNVRAPFALTQAALPHLRGGGVVIFISSIAGHAAFPYSAAYCATKGAVELMTRALAVELAPVPTAVLPARSPLIRRTAPRAGPASSACGGCEAAASSRRPPRHGDRARRGSGGAPP